MNNNKNIYASDLKVGEQFYYTNRAGFPAVAEVLDIRSMGPWVRIVAADVHHPTRKFVKNVTAGVTQVNLA